MCRLTMLVSGAGDKLISVTEPGAESKSGLIMVA